MASQGAGADGLGVVVHTDEVEKLFQKLMPLVEDMRPVFLGRIRPSIARHLLAQFETRGTHLGTPWPALSPVTIALRTRRVLVNEAGRISKKGKYRATTSKVGRAKAGFSTPMQDTRELYTSLTRLVDPLGIRVVKPLEMAWGTRSAHAAPHHTPGGFATRLFGKGPTRHVPARPVIPQTWPAPIVQEWASDMLAYLKEST
jgi:hypothetical protein